MTFLKRYNHDFYEYICINVLFRNILMLGPIFVKLTPSQVSATYIQRWYNDKYLEQFKEIRYQMPFLMSLQIFNILPPFFTLMAFLNNEIGKVIIPNLLTLF